MYLYSPISYNFSKNYKTQMNLDDNNKTYENNKVTMTPFDQFDNDDDQDIAKQLAQYSFPMGFKRPSLSPGSSVGHATFPTSPTSPASPGGYPHHRRHSHKRSRGHSVESSKSSMSSMTADTSGTGTTTRSTSSSAYTQQLIDNSNIPKLIDLTETDKPLTPTYEKAQLPPQFPNFIYPRSGSFNRMTDLREEEDINGAEDTEEDDEDEQDRNIKEGEDSCTGFMEFLQEPYNAKFVEAVKNEISKMKREKLAADETRLEQCMKKVGDSKNQEEATLAQDHVCTEKMELTDDEILSSVTRQRPNLNKRGESFERVVVQKMKKMLGSMK